MGETLEFYDEVQFRGRVSLVCGDLMISTIIVARLDGSGPLGYAGSIQIFSGIGLLFGAWRSLPKRREEKKGGLDRSGPERRTLDIWFCGRADRRTFI